MVFINKKMGVVMQGSGLIVKWMVKENTHGLMEKFMMENMFKIKNKVMVDIFGKVDAYMMDIGKMVFNMAGDD